MFLLKMYTEEGVYKHINITEKYSNFVLNLM